MMPSSDLVRTQLLYDSQVMLPLAAAASVSIPINTIMGGKDSFI